MEKKYKIDIPLFHWAPSKRRKQIIRYGLRPRMQITTNPPLEQPDFRHPCVCFAESPSWAWGLSGAFSPEILDWDLWQTSFNILEQAEIVRTYDSHRWHEVRTSVRVPKSKLWYVGSRSTEVKV